MVAEAHLDIWDCLLPSLPDGRIVSVSVGLYWTAVVADVRGMLRCGLAATLANPEFETSRLPAVGEPGTLENRPALELAGWVSSPSYTEAGIGLATINALLPPPASPADLKAQEYIAREGAGGRVALIGHFPFVSELRQRVRELWVLELNPQEGDLPASSAPEIIPQADVLAITSTTLINHTFAGLFVLRKPGAKTLLLGPSTPLSPLLFGLGMHVLSGVVTQDPDQIVQRVRQGATFRQLRNHGVRLVTLGST